jgi:hypothetical protein
MDQEYTDNLFLMTALGGEDFVSTLRPGFSAAAGSERSGCSADYDFGYSRYWRLREGFTEHNARGNLWHEWEFLRFDATGHFVRREYPIEFAPGTGAVLSLRNAVSPYYRAGATPGLAYEFGEERSIRVGYDYESYWSHDARFQDSAMNSPNVALTCGLDAFNVIGLSYAHERGSFSAATFSATPDFLAHRVGAQFTHRLSPHTDAVVSYRLTDLAFDTGTGYRTHQATLGTHWDLSELTTLGLAGGYFLIDRPGSRQDGPLLSAEVVRELYRGHLSAGGEWGFGEDYFSSENLGVYTYWNARLGADYQLREHLRAGASGTYQSNDFSLVGRTDDYWSATGNLSWLIEPWLTARLSYSHTRYRSFASSQFRGQVWDFAVNSLLLNLTSTFEWGGSRGDGPGGSR